MTAPNSSTDANPRLGLCGDCLHSRLIESSKGSQFFLCQLSQSDPTFSKYPRLPVIACTGYSLKPVA
jgi:hypothetical protein